ncbi:MAG: HD domain-containing protein [Candidatus Zambryskibacteria bacterium]|nr:HD domain-containing protein [Candidatus Zambryskibacteria bacterium]
MAKRDIDFLFEIGSLRKVPRAWQQVLNGRVQNIAEHHFRVTLIAWTIAIAERADVNKVLQIALIHDIGESRAGDIAFMHRDYVIRHEELAEEHVFQNTILEKEAGVLLSEYSERKTLEAKIVKDADNLDVDLELKELAQIGDSAAIGMQKNHRPFVRTIKLYTKTAKKMWDQIQKTDPNAWHQALSNKWIKNKKGAK